MSDIPEPDQIAGAPHPRDTPQLFAQEGAEQAFLSAWQSGRMHHAWLITGPKGIGKATLAYNIARFVLASPPDDGLFAGEQPDFHIPADHPVRTRISARSEPGLYVLNRPWDEKKEKHAAVITVDAVRRMQEKFLTLSAGGNGWRVVIVDAMDEMNTNAANAFLKSLEEPPAKTLMLLLAHQVAGLLPTIRSRCRLLPCHPLPSAPLQSAFEQALPDIPYDPALGVLAGGSVGRAVELALKDGADQYRALVDLLHPLPQLDRAAVVDFANKIPAGAKGAEQFAHILTLLDILLWRLTRHPMNGGGQGITPQEQDVFERINPTPQSAQKWAQTHQFVMDRARHALAVNLDPSGMILDMLLKIETCAIEILR